MAKSSGGAGRSGGGSSKGPVQGTGKWINFKNDRGERIGVTFSSKANVRGRNIYGFGYNNNDLGRGSGYFDADSGKTYGSLEDAIGKVVYERVSGFSGSSRLRTFSATMERDVTVAFTRPPTSALGK